MVRVGCTVRAVHVGCAGCAVCAVPQAVQGAWCVPCRRVLQGSSAPRGKEPPVLPGGVWGGTSARRAAPGPFSQGIHSPTNVPAVPSGVSVLQSARGGEGQGKSTGHQSFGVLWCPLVAVGRLLRGYQRHRGHQVGWALRHPALRSAHTWHCALPGEPAGC